MKKWTSIGACAASIVVLASLAGCGTPTNSNTTASSGTSSEPTLIMATSADYKPYEYHDTAGGQDQIVGFDVDVANAIAKQLHFKMKIEDMDFDSLIGALQSKRADFVIAGMTATPTRKKSVDFSNVYYQATNVVLTKKGVDIKTMDDLKGDKVAAQLGSIQETAAKAIPNVQLDSIDTIPDVVQEVVTGRATAAVIENTVATGYVKSDPQLQINNIKGMTANGSAIAFPKGSKWTAKFNTAIATMKKDGELKKLENKWFGGQNA